MSAWCLKNFLFENDVFVVLIVLPDQDSSLDPFERLTIRDRGFAIDNLRSTICGRQFAIDNLRSTICNR